MRVKIIAREPERVPGGYNLQITGSHPTLGESSRSCGIYRNDGPEGRLTSDNAKQITDRLSKVQPEVEPTVAAQPAVPAELDSEGVEITPARPAVEAKPAVLGKSPRELLLDWFKEQAEKKRTEMAEVPLPKVERKRPDGSVVMKNGKPEMVVDDKLEEADI